MSVFLLSKIVVIVRSLLNRNYRQSIMIEVKEKRIIIKKKEEGKA